MKRQLKCRLCKKDIPRTWDYEEELCGSCTLWKMVTLGKCKIEGAKDFCNKDKTEEEKKEIWNNLIKSYAHTIRTNLEI